MAYCSNCGAEEAADQQFCANCGTATNGTFANPGPLPYFPMDPPVAAGPPLAGYWWRVLAYLIDAIILGLVINLPLRSSSTNVYLVSILNVVAIFLYATFFLTRMKGQTIGMMVARIRCVDESSTGHLTIAQALRRNGLFCFLDLIGSVYHYTRYATPTHAQNLLNDRHSIISLALLVPVILDILWPIWDKKNQALHDKFAHTIVLRPANN